MGRLAVGASLLLAVLLLPQPALGYKIDPAVPRQVYKLPERQVLVEEYSEESESLLDYFKQRLDFGVGYDVIFTDNFNTDVDSRKEDDLISVAEAFLFFADPRGALLYGLRHEMNAYRYHRHDVNALDHDFRGFADYDPGGRIQFHLDYDYTVNNVLTLGSGDIDILRRGTDFNRIDTHRWSLKTKYALNETNDLVHLISYHVIDDLSANDAETDRRTFSTALDLNHDLTPTWAAIVGYQFDDLFLPGSKSKNSETHGVRLGLRYERTEANELDLLLRVGGVEFKDGTTDTNIGFEGKWEWSLGPRTSVLLSYSDQEQTSFSAGRLRFRSQSPALTLSYDLTPLVTWNFRAGLSKQTSDSSDAQAGATVSEETNEQYDLKTGLEWQVRDNVAITLEYLFSRSKTRDVTKHTGQLGVEVQL